MNKNNKNISIEEIINHYCEMLDNTNKTIKILADIILEHNKEMKELKNHIKEIKSPNPKINLTNNNIFSTKSLKVGDNIKFDIKKLKDFVELLYNTTKNSIMPFNNELLNQYIEDCLISNKYIYGNIIDIDKIARIIVVEFDSSENKRLTFFLYELKDLLYEGE